MEKIFEFLEKKVIKRTVLIVTVCALVINSVICSYASASTSVIPRNVNYTADVAGVAGSGTAVISLLISILTGSGIYMESSYTNTANDVEAKLDEEIAEELFKAEVLSLDVEEVIEKHKSGATLSDAEKYVLNVHLENVKYDYCQLLNDMALNEDLALSYDDVKFIQTLIKDLSPLDLVNEDYEVSQARLLEIFREYTVKKNMIESSIISGINGTFKFTANLINEIAKDMVMLVDASVELGNYMDGLHFTMYAANDYNFSISTSNSSEIFKNVSADSALIEKLNTYNSENRPYLLFCYFSNTGEVSRFTFFQRNGDKSTTAGSVINLNYYEYDTNNIRLKASGSGRYSMKEYEYYSNGDVSINYSSSTTCTLYHGTLINWQNVIFDSKLLSVLGVDSLETSFPYGSVETKPQNAYDNLDIVRPETLTTKPVYIDNSALTDVINDAIALPGLVDVGADEEAEEKKVVIDLPVGIEGVSDNTLDRVTADEKADLIAGVDAPSINTPAEVGTDMTAKGLDDVFPFCIPFDLINGLKMLAVPGKAPRWEFPIIIESLDFEYTIVLDFNDFNKVAQACRFIETIGFIYFLIIKTRGIIRG